MVKILKAINDSGIDYVGIAALGSFPMSDQYGNTTEDNVVAVQYLKDTVNKINWDNFLNDNAFIIADVNFNSEIFNK